MAKTVYLKIINKCNHKHPVYDEPIIAFLYDYSSKKISYFNFLHQDVEINSTWDKFKNKIKNYKIFVINKKKYKYLLEDLELNDVNSIQFCNEGNTFESEWSNPLMLNDFINDHNLAIPFVKHQSDFENELDSFAREIKSSKYDVYSFKFFNNLLSDTLYEIEKNGIKLNLEEFEKFYPDKKYENYAYTQYNIYNPTGRPSNNFDGINYVALNKDNGCRKSFISRYDNGYYLMVDFTGFHPYIVSSLINYKVPDEETIYEHLAKKYYNIVNVTSDDISKAKKLTMVNLYGDIKKDYLKIEFFKKTDELKNKYWETFLRKGYVESPIYKRKITNHHIKDANKNKLFSYIIQATETEYGINSLDRCIKFAGDKKIKPILYVYDSVVFDVDKSVEKQDILDLIDIFKSNRFKVKAYAGKNYDDLVCIIN